MRITPAYRNNLVEMEGTNAVIPLKSVMKRRGPSIDY